MRWFSLFTPSRVAGVNRSFCGLAQSRSQALEERRCVTDMELRKNAQERGGCLIKMEQWCAAANAGGLLVGRENSNCGATDAHGDST